MRSPALFAALALALASLAPSALANPTVPLNNPVTWAAWSKVQGNDPNLAQLAANQTAFRSIRNPAEKTQATAAAQQLLTDTYRDAFNPATQRIEIQTNTRTSIYDRDNQGVRLQLFEGDRFFTLGGNTQVGTVGRYPVTLEVPKTEVRFTNAPDLAFLPLPVTSFAPFTGGSPDRAANLTVRLQVQPVAATFRTEKRQAIRELYVHVTRLEVLAPQNRFSRTQPPPIATRDLPPVAPADLGRRFSTTLTPSGPPVSGNRLAKLWHNAVGTTPINLDAYAASDPDVRRADEFDKPNVLADRVAQLKADLIDTPADRTLTLTLNASLGEYDFDRQGFVIPKLDTGRVRYTSLIPFVKPKPSRVVLQPEFNPFAYTVALANPEDLQLIGMPPAEAEALAKRIDRSRRIQLDLTLTAESAVPVDETATGASALPRQVNFRVVNALARSTDTGLVLFERRFDPPTGPVAAAQRDIGVDPATADIKGLRTTITAEQFLADAQATFASARFLDDKPHAVHFRQPNELGFGYFDTNRRIYAISYKRYFKGDAIDAAADALIKKYGPPVDDSGRKATRFEGVERTLSWNPPGAFGARSSAGVNASIRRDSITSGRTIMEVNIRLPGQHTPFKPDETTTPDIDL
ncbi:MAG: DUF4852 domain-containing protein [Planctomycetota bacterium]